MCIRDRFATTLLGDNSTSIVAFNSTSAITGYDVGSSCIFSNGTIAFARSTANETLVTYYDEEGNTSTYTLSSDVASSIDTSCRESSLLVAMQTLNSYELLEYNDGVNSLNSGSVSVTTAKAVIVDSSMGSALFATSSGYELCDNNSCTIIGGAGSLAGIGLISAATDSDGTSWILHDGGNSVASLAILDGSVVNDVWTYSSSQTSQLNLGDMEVDDDGTILSLIHI